jgi:hypothetical protein
MVYDSLYVKILDITKPQKCRWDRWLPWLGVRLGRCGYRMVTGVAPERDLSCIFPDCETGGTNQHMWKHGIQLNVHMEISTR